MGWGTLIETGVNLFRSAYSMGWVDKYIDKMGIFAWDTMLFTGVPGGIGTGLVDPVSYYLTKWTSPEPLGNQPASPTYAGSMPQLTATPGRAVPVCSGIVCLAGNIIRQNDFEGEDYLKLIVDYGEGEWEEILATYVNGIEWSHLQGVHYKYEHLGTPDQTGVTNLFGEDNCNFRNRVVVEYKFTKGDEIKNISNIIIIARTKKYLEIGQDIGGTESFTRNPAQILWDFYLKRKGADYTTEMNPAVNDWLSLEEYCGTSLCDTDSSYYPVNVLAPSENLVKATSAYAERSEANLVNFNNPTTGPQANVMWISADSNNANQRINFDFGRKVVVTRLMLCNYHESGSNTNYGIQNFVLQGSNSSASFDSVTYTSTGWTDVKTGLTADQHDPSNIADWETIDIDNNTTGYRYYALKISNNYGGAYMGLRQVRFFTGNAPSACTNDEVNVRYTFDYNNDSHITINDYEKLIWESFNGMVIRSQGIYKPIWEGAEEADGSGSLQNKAVKHVFTVSDNTVEKSLSWTRGFKANVFRVYFIDSVYNFKKNGDAILKNEQDILVRGEETEEEQCNFIIDQCVAVRRVKLKYNKAKSTDYEAGLTGFPDSQGLELFDRVQAADTEAGWSGKDFFIDDKDEDKYGRSVFLLREYFSGAYDDNGFEVQPGYPSRLINPDAPSDPIETDSVAVTNVDGGTSVYSSGKLSITFSPPSDPNYSYTEIWLSTDDSTYRLAGQDSDGSTIIDGLGTFYDYGDTVYVKFVNVNDNGVSSVMPSSYDGSVTINSKIKMSNFFFDQYDMWGGNVDSGELSISGENTSIVLGGLNDPSIGHAKIALGPQAGLMTLANVETYPGFYADGTGSFRHGGPGAYGVFDVDAGTYTFHGVTISSDSSVEVSGTTANTFTVDSDGYQMVLTPGSNTFNITTGTASLDIASGVTIDINGNLTVESASYINQDVTSDGVPTFAGIKYSSSFVISGSSLGDSSPTRSLILASTSVLQGVSSIVDSIIVGDDILHTNADTVEYSVIVGYKLARDISTPDTITNNVIVGSDIAYDTSDSIKYNCFVGDYIFNGVTTGNLLETCAVGSYIASASLGGGSTSRCNLLVGNNLAESVTGVINSSTIVGQYAVYNTTNATTLESVIALGENTLRDSSASDLDYSIAIGYTAGQNNAYTNPALFGAQAVATAHKQVVIGSSYYTGGYNITAGGTSHISTSSGNVEIDPAGDIILDPAGDDVLPGAQDINLGSLPYKYLTLHVKELWAQTLVAEDVISTIGGHIITAPTTRLAEDITTDTTFDVEDASSFAVNDYIMMASSPSGTPQFEVMQITNISTNTITVTRNEDGSGLNNWSEGDAIVNIGYAANEGWIEQYALSSVSESTIGPTVVGWIRTATTNWSDYVEGWALGNLNGLYGYSSNMMGIGLGAYSEGNYITIDPTNGIQFYDATDTKRASLSSSTWSLGTVGGSRVSIRTTGIAMYDANNNIQVEINSTPWVAIGDSDSTDWIQVNASSIDIYHGGSVYTSLSAGALTLGLSTAEHVVINGDGVSLYDNTSMYARFAATTTVGVTSGYHTRIVSGGVYLRNGTDNYLSLGSSGVIVGLTSSGTYSQMESGSYKIYDNSQLHFYLNSGTMQLGYTSVGGGGGDYIEISATAGIEMYANGVLGTKISNAGVITLYDSAGADRIVIDTDGIVVGDESDGEYVEITSSGVTLYGGASAVISITSAGLASIDMLDGSDLNFFASSSSSAVITFDTTNRTFTMGCAYDDDKVFFHSDSSRLGYFCVGLDEDSNYAHIYDFEVYSAGTYFECGDDSGTGDTSYITQFYESIEIYAESTTYYDVGIYMDYGYITLDFNNTNMGLFITTHKDNDCGESDHAWDYVFSDDFTNVADFYHMDSYDDLQALHDIKGSGIIDPLTGHELIDDDTLPEWLLSKYKKNISRTVPKDGNFKKERKDGKRQEKEIEVMTKNKGDIMYDPEGKPYLSFKAVSSLLMGAIRQLDNKYEDHLNNYH